MSRRTVVMRIPFPATEVAAVLAASRPTGDGGAPYTTITRFVAIDRLVGSYGVET
jgi:hypothetical protein